MTGLRAWGLGISVALASLALTVLAIYLVVRVLRGHWSARVIPLAASLVILAGPAEIGKVAIIAPRKGPERSTRKEAVTTIPALAANLTASVSQNQSSKGHSES